MVSPRKSRSKSRCCSSNVTAIPWRASRSASTAPAGPLPTMQQVVLSSCFFGCMLLVSSLSIGVPPILLPLVTRSDQEGDPPAIMGPSWFPMVVPLPVGHMMRKTLRQCLMLFFYYKRLDVVSRRAAGPERQQSEQDDDGEKRNIEQHHVLEKVIRPCTDGYCPDSKHHSSIDGDGQRQSSQPEPPACPAKVAVHKAEGQGGIDKVSRRHPVQETNQLSGPATRWRREGRGSRSHQVAAIEDKMASL